MKKVICLGVVLCMVLSFGTVVFGATDKTISTPLNVVPGGQGIGFYDNAGTGTSPEVYVGDLILRFAEWTKYDVADLDDGTYKVTINTATTGGTYVAVLANDALMAKKTVPANGGTYATFVSTELGSVYLSGSAKTITIKNCGLLNAMVVKTISLTRTDPGDITTPIIYDAQNVFSTVEGVGYHDIAGAAFSNSAVTSAGTSSTIMHGTITAGQTPDWDKYDISGLAPGLYELKTKAGYNGTIVNFDIMLDGVTKIKGSPIDKSGAYTTFLESTVGNILIPEGAGTITIRNNSLSASTVYLRSFSLRRVSDRDSIAPVIKIYAKSIISSTSGVGYLDAAGTDLTVTSTDPAQKVVLKTGDWLRYGMTDVPAGRYRLSLNCSNTMNAIVEVSTDVGTVATQNVVATNVTVPLTGSYTTFQDFNLGYIDIPSNTSALTLKSTGANAMQLTSLTLEQLPLELSTNYTSNVEGTTTINSIGVNNTIYSVCEVSNSAYANNIYFTAIVAVYDGNELVYCTSDPQTLAKGATFKHIYPVTGLASGYSVKTFIWSSIISMKPLLTYITEIK